MRSKQHIFKFGKNGKTVQARKSTDLQAQTRVKEMWTDSIRLQKQCLSMLF